MEDGKKAKGTKRLFITNTVILVATALIVLFLNISMKSFDFSQTKNEGNLSTLVKEIKYLNKITIFEIEYEDIIEVNNEKITESNSKDILLKEGVLRYSGKALFGIDFSRFDQQYIDEKNKIIYIPHVTLLDVELNSFSPLFEHYETVPKSSHKINDLNENEQIKIEDKLLDKYIRAAKENLENNALKIFETKKVEIDKKGVEIFKNYFAKVLGIDGYKISYKE